MPRRGVFRSVGLYNQNIKSYGTVRYGIDFIVKRGFVWQKFEESPVIRISEILSTVVSFCGCILQNAPQIAVICGS